MPPTVFLGGGWDGFAGLAGFGGAGALWRMAGVDAAFAVLQGSQPGAPFAGLGVGGASVGRLCGHGHGKGQGEEKKKVFHASTVRLCW